MASSIAALTAGVNSAVGEVASLKGGLIEVFIYPEFYSKIGIGSIFIIKSEGNYPIGISLKLIHESRTGTFTPLRRTREKIRKSYPDIDEYIKFVTTIVYTSFSDGKRIYHYRGNPPLLHDLVFLFDKDHLDLYFRPNGFWNFNFLRYFLENGASVLEFRDFLLRHKEFFQEHSDEKIEIIRAITEAIKGTRDDINLLLKEMVSFFQRI